MTARDRILSRLESARGDRKSVGVPPVPSGKEIFADYPGGDLVTRFQEKLSSLRGECFVSSSIDELARKLEQVLGELPEGQVVSQDTQFLRAVTQRLSPRARDVARSSTWSLENHEFGSFVASITTADAFFARTGSVALRSTTAGGRRLSVLPPVHIVLGTTSQIKSSPENWFSEIKNDPTWSFGTIISGPSRTGDIEKILVLGAHGPKRLVILLLQDSQVNRPS